MGEKHSSGTCLYNYQLVSSVAFRHMIKSRCVLFCKTPIGGVLVSRVQCRIVCKFLHVCVFVWGSVICQFSHYALVALRMDQRRGLWRISRPWNKMQLYVIVHGEENENTQANLHTQTHSDHWGWPFLALPSPLLQTVTYFVCLADALPYFYWRALAHLPAPQSIAAHVDPGFPLLSSFSLSHCVAVVCFVICLKM